MITRSATQLFSARVRYCDKTGLCAESRVLGITIGPDTDIAPDSGIKSHLLAVGLVSSEITVSMALDLGSEYVQLCYREWVSVGVAPISVMNHDTHKFRLLMTPIQGIEA